MKEKFQLFSDESGHSRFRSIGALSGSKDNIDTLKGELSLILNDRKRKSIEFKEITGNKKAERVAIDFIRKGIDYCSAKKIRIDVLTWDIEDKRHDVPNRDDIKNLQFMYYKVIKWVNERWKNVTTDWEFYPDEHSSINWREPMYYIENTNLEREKDFDNNLFEEVKTYSFPSFSGHSEMKSHEEPVIQMIDLFTGFARFSFDKGEEFLSWKEEEDRRYQQGLFKSLQQKMNLSKGNASKFRVLMALYDYCKQGKMGVSMSKNAHLHTFQPSRYLNFWPYKPQGDYDKAPTLPHTV